MTKRVVGRSEALYLAIACTADPGTPILLPTPAGTAGTHLLLQTPAGRDAPGPLRAAHIVGLPGTVFGGAAETDRICSARPADIIHRAVKRLARP